MPSSYVRLDDIGGNRPAIADLQNGAFGWAADASFIRDPRGAALALRTPAPTR